MERSPRCAGRWLLRALVLLGGLTLANAGARMRPSELEAATRSPANSVCLDSGSALLMDWGAIDGAGPAPESGDAERPMRADCGSGEAWRRHVP